MHEYDDAVVRSAEANKKLNDARAAREDAATIEKLRNIADALAKEVEDNARRKGVEILHNWQVRNVIFDGARVSGVRVLDNDGNEQIVTSRYVIDASGHTSRDGHQMQFTGQREYGYCIFSHEYTDIGSGQTVVHYAKVPCQ